MKQECCTQCKNYASYIRGSYLNVANSLQFACQICAINNFKLVAFRIADYYNEDGTLKSITPSTTIKNCTIIVNGKTVGYQFNKKSLGNRTFKNKKVTTDENNNYGTVYISYLKRSIRVKAISSHLWEAI